MKNCCERCVDVEDMSGDGIGVAREYCTNPSCPCHQENNPSMEWEKQFDKLTGLEMVGTARTYTKHVDPEAIKGFIVMTLTAQREEYKKIFIDLLDVTDVWENDWKPRTAQSFREEIEKAVLEAISR